MHDPVKDSFKAILQQREEKRRIDAERALTNTVAKINEVDERWSEEAVRAALTPIIADIIRDSGRKEPEALSRSLAPHVVTTVKAEIKNSEKEIIDVLHPKLGVLIQRSVDSAIKELEQKVDNALPIDKWIAKITSRVTGAPALGLIIDDEPHFFIHEVLLIERGSGQLLARELNGIEDHKAADTEVDGDLLSGMIAAIDAFASDILSNEVGTSLRTIETESGSLLVRASETRILAMRVEGEPSAEAEKRLELLLDAVLSRDSSNHGSILTNGPLLVEDQTGSSEISAFGIVVKAMAALVTIVLLIISHISIEAMRRERAADRIEETAASAEGMRSYPVNTEFKGSDLIVSGIVPDDKALSDVTTALSNLPENYPVKNELVVAGQRYAR